MQVFFDSYDDYIGLQSMYIN